MLREYIMMIFSYFGAIFDEIRGQNDQEIDKKVVRRGKENLMRKKVVKRTAQGEPWLAKRGYSPLQRANNFPSRIHLGLISSHLGLILVPFWVILESFFDK